MDVHRGDIPDLGEVRFLEHQSSSLTLPLPEIQPLVRRGGGKQVVSDQLCALERRSMGAGKFEDAGVGEVEGLVEAKLGQKDAVIVTPTDNGEFGIRGDGNIKAVHPGLMGLEPGEQLAKRRFCELDLLDRVVLFEKTPRKIGHIPDCDFPVGRTREHNVMNLSSWNGNKKRERGQVRKSKRAGVQRRVTIPI